MNAEANETVNVPQSETSEGFAVGKTVNGKYVIEKQLGVGGMGLTYLASDTANVKRKLVIKTILKRFSTDEGKIAFLKEGEALGRINHDGVVKFFDGGEDAETGLPFLAMEYVEGIPLSAIIERGQMDLRKVINITEKIAFALNAAHSKSVLHRDLKPTNIMIVESEVEGEKIKLIDFGVAKVADSVVSGGSTVFGSFKGTLQYASPEQLSGFQTEVGETFNLAALVYEMLTQKLPFPITVRRFPDEDTDSLTGRAFAQIKSLQQQGASSPQQINPQISEAVAKVVLKGLAYDPVNRYQTPIELARELKNSSLAPTPEILSKTSKSWAKPLVFLPVVILLIAGLGWLGLNYLSTLRPTAPSNPGGQIAPANTEKAEIVFSYSFDVRKIKDDLPTGETFTTADKSKIAVGDLFNLKIERETSGWLYLLEQNGEYLDLIFSNGNENAKTASRWNVAKAGRTFWLVWSKNKIDVLETSVNNQAEIIKFLQSNQKNVETTAQSDLISVKSFADAAVHKISW